MRDNPTIRLIQPHGEQGIRPLVHHDALVSRRPPSGHPLHGFDYPCGNDAGSRVMTSATASASII